MRDSGIFSCHWHEALYAILRRLPYTTYWYCFKVHRSACTVPIKHPYVRRPTLVCFALMCVLSQSSTASYFRHPLLLIRGARMYRYRMKADQLEMSLLRNCRGDDSYVSGSDKTVQHRSRGLLSADWLPSSHWNFSATKEFPEQKRCAATAVRTLLVGCCEEFRKNG